MSADILNLLAKSLVNQLFSESIFGTVEDIAVGRVDVVNVLRFVENDQHERLRLFLLLFITKGDFVVDSKEKIGEDVNGVETGVDDEGRLVRLQNGVTEVLRLFYALLLNDFPANFEDGLLGFNGK